MGYIDRIAIAPGKRGGRPVIRGLRITVFDVLGWLAGGMTADEIIDDFPELERADIQACLAFAADRERRAVVVQTRILTEHCAAIADAIADAQVHCLEVG
jgi:uncharacterized protein (DUF433 family)